mgnify:CR=1 FL=1
MNPKIFTVKPVHSRRLRLLLAKINGDSKAGYYHPTSYEDLMEREKEMSQPFTPMDPEPMSADAWAKFKIRWVEEYGGEPVNPVTGMTASEFIKYITLSGYREGVEFDDPEYFWWWERLKTARRDTGESYQHIPRWYDSNVMNPTL